MKPMLLLSTLLAVAIVVAASFDLHIMPIAPIHNIPESMQGAVLYVCPAGNEIFEGIARSLNQFRRPMTVAFFFFFILVFIAYGWALYQNLLEDKFVKKKYDFAWFLAKSVFWIMIVVTVLLHTPNAYRTVRLNGAEGDFVLCESNAKGSRAVHAHAVLKR